MSTPADTATANAGSAKGESAGAVSPKDAPSAQSVRKDSTVELPLIDLGEAVNFVSTIHEKALETAQMPQVATSMGYKNPSSTPFYRRCVASRLFGLMAKSGVELSARARDYLKPDAETARGIALTESIMGIPLYGEEVNRHLGKRLNTTYIAHSFSKALPITDGCAMECARAFERSLRFAGFLSSDGTVAMPVIGGAVSPVSNPTPAQDPEDEPEDKGAQKHTLYLDKTKERTFTISAPLDVNPAEVKRIQRWLEVTLLIDWNETPGGS